LTSINPSGGGDNFWINFEVSHLVELVELGETLGDFFSHLSHTMCALCLLLLQLSDLFLWGNGQHPFIHTWTCSLHIMVLITSGDSLNQQDLTSFSIGQSMSCLVTWPINMDKSTRYKLWCCSLWSESSMGLIYSFAWHHHAGSIQLRDGNTGLLASPVRSISVRNFVGEIVSSGYGFPTRWWTDDKLLVYCRKLVGLGS
jgi:hypothetical protein